jgi:hypothetical protein
MTFTQPDPSTVRGLVRLLIGDNEFANGVPTAAEDLRLEDEDIDALIRLSTTLDPAGVAADAQPQLIYLAAAEAGDALRAKFLRKAEGSVGPQRIQPTSRAQELANLVSQYRNRAKRGGSPVAPSTSIASNVSMNSDTDRNGSWARMGMMDRET